jgi:hypothetical protein
MNKHITNHYYSEVQGKEHASLAFSTNLLNAISPEGNGTILSTAKAK